MTDPLRSERLVFRAMEVPDDVEWYYQMRTDAVALGNSTLNLLKPKSRKNIEDDLKMYSENTLMSVMICLPADSSDVVAGDEAQKPNKPTPIGSIGIIPDGPPHHRAASIGLDLREEYRGKGYGSEAIEFALKWGFQIAGQHRIAIGAAGHNTGAVKLYDRMGFVREFTKREAIWYNGQWNDYIEWSLLEHEWRERQQKRDKH